MIQSPREIGPLKPEKLTPWEKLFSVKYALLDYEQFWLPGETYYEPSAQIQSRLADGIKKGEVVVDLGCGTGNSTAVLIKSNPDFGKMFAIDPNHEFLRLAQYKFGKISEEEWMTQIKDLLVDPRVLTNVGKVKNEMISISNRVEVIRSRGDQIPLAPNSIDRIHCIQSLHWMAFADADTEGNIGYLSHALTRMRQVLKPGGLLIFDTGGYQYDFGEKTFRGKPINDLHWSRTPFYSSFVDNFNAVLNKRGIQGRPDKFYQMFSFDLIKKLLVENGFESQLIEGQKYKFDSQPRDEENVLKLIMGGSPMRQFTTKELADLPYETKMAMINEALSATAEELLQPSTETYAFFVAKAV